MISKNEIVEHLYEYKVVCSYDELKRFRPSVSCDASERVNQNILKFHTGGLVLAVVDNLTVTSHLQMVLSRHTSLR